MTLRTKLLTTLAFLALVDVLVPFPLLVAFLIYVVAARPSFFRAWVEEIYAISSSD